MIAVQRGNLGLAGYLQILKGGSLSESHIITPTSHLRSLNRVWGPREETLEANSDFGVRFGDLPKVWG